MVNKRNIVLGLIFIFGFEFVLRNIFLPAQDTITGTHLSVLLLIEWLPLLFLLCVWAPRFEGVMLGFGFTAVRWRHLGIGCVAFVVVMLLSGIYYEVVSKPLALEGLRDLQPLLARLSPLSLILLFFTGVFFEEIVYRGYLMERVRFLTGSIFIAGLVSWFLFVTVHFVFFGLGPMLESAILAAALVILYARTRSIWPSIMLHGLNNFIGYILFPLIVPLLGG